MDPLSIDEFLSRLQWKMGEHVSLIGATGRGKTTLGMELLAFRRASVVWSAKASDETVDKYVTPGTFKRSTSSKPFKQIKNWPPATGQTKVVLRPKVGGLDSARGERYREFHKCADSIMSPKVGGWCIFADDTFYLCEHLKLTNDLTEIWSMGRSHGVSLVAGIQRPAFVPLLAYQATHLFFWRENNSDNLKRLTEIGVDNPKVIEEIVRNLDAEKEVCCLIRK